MNNIKIVFSFDDNYLIAGYTAITSLLVNAKKNTFYEIYILEDKELSNENKKYIRELEKEYNTIIRYIKVDYLFDTTKLKAYFTKSIYYRLLIPRLLKDVDKVIYLDSDIIVNDDLNELYNIDINNFYIGAVKDQYCNLYEKEYIKNNLKLDPNNYINSGVLLINCKKMREDNLIEKFIEESYNEYKFPDQCILNKVCYGKILYLNPKYNINYLFLNKEYYTKEELNDLLFNPIIYHYFGYSKPWIKFCLNDEMQSFWLYYYKKTPFYKKDDIIKYGHYKNIIEMQELKKDTYKKEIKEL